MGVSRSDTDWMQLALATAREGEALGEVPVGAVVVLDNELIGSGFNQPISAHDPTAHAEVVALRAAAQQLQNYRLTGATLYVTIEPCAMCAGAIIHSRIARVVFGATEPRAGAVCSHLNLFDREHGNHRVEWEQGACGEEAATLLREFFARKRQ